MITVKVDTSIRSLNKHTYVRSQHSLSSDTSDTAQLAQTLLAQAKFAPSPGLTQTHLQQSYVI